MSRQWKRLLNLQVDGTTIVASGSDVSAGLRVQFKIEKMRMGTPGVAHVTVTNLSDRTANALAKLEAPVILSGGYLDNSGLLFTGTVNQYIKGRESPTDKTFQIFARDTGTVSDGHVQAVVSKALAKGSTPLDHFNAIADAFAPYGIKKGFAPADVLSRLKYPRGVSLFGMAKDLMRDLALSNQSSWSIQDGTVQMLSINAQPQTGPFVLNSATGLIGIPTQTSDGIMVRCLINPKISLLAGHNYIQVDQKLIQQQAQSQAFTGDVSNAQIPVIATDGIYEVVYIEVTGDTRGVPWYMDLTCKAANTPGYFPNHKYLLVN